MSAWQQRPDGHYVPAEPLPEPFGVLWGRLWQQRKKDGCRFALVRAWFDARAISKLARGGAK